MQAWTRQAIEILSQHASCALVTVVEVQGSAPVGPGTKMLVWEDGQHGTIGGGNLEWTVAGQARRLAAQGSRQHVLQKYPLGPLLRQCCGGNVRVLIERLTPASRAWLETVDAVLAAGVPGVLRTLMSGSAIDKQVEVIPVAPIVT